MGRGVKRQSTTNGKSSKSTIQNESACEICVEHTSAKNLKIHQQTSTHSMTVKTFERTYHPVADGYRCNVCDDTIESSDLKSHAKLHRIVPWYEPDDKHKFFFENHTLKFDRLFYCYICDTLFDNWFSTYYHIIDSEHETLAKQVTKDFPVQGSLSKLCRKLITMGYVPTGSREVKCNFCVDVVIGIENITTHSKTPEHAQKIANFIDSLSNRAIIEGLRKPTSSTEAKKISSNILETTSSEKKINGVQNSRGMICNFSLDQPTESPKSTKVPDTSHTLEFIVNTDHPLCTNTKAQKVINTAEPYCLICFIIIPPDSSVSVHVQGRRHLKSRKKFGCDEITKKSADTYNCELCDATPMNFIGLYKHIKSDSHARSLAKAKSLNDSISTACDENFQNESSNESPMKITNCIYIVRKDKYKSYCQICDEKEEFSVSTRKVKQHIEGKMHKTAIQRYGCKNIITRASGDYHCQCCKLELSDLWKLYTHVKSKRHTDALIAFYKNRNVMWMTPREALMIPDQSDNCQETSETQCNQAKPTSNGDAVELEKKFKVVENRKIRKSSKPAVVGWAGQDETNCDGTNINTCNFCGLVAKTMAELHIHMADHFINEINTAATRQKIRKREFPLSKQRRRITDEPDMRQFEKVKNMPATNEFPAIGNPQVDLPNANGEACEIPMEYPSNRNNSETSANAINTNEMAIQYRENSDLNFSEYLPVQLPFSNYLPGNNGFVFNNLENNVDAETIENSGIPAEYIPGSLVARAPSVTDESSTDSSVTDDAPDKSLDEHEKNWKKYAKQVKENTKFDEDWLYESCTKDKLEAIDFDLSLCTVTNENEIYCLICRETVVGTYDDYIEHLFTLNHCCYLEQLHEDHEKFKNYSEQISDFDLAREFMEDTSDKEVHCYVCNVDVKNSDSVLRRHKKNLHHKLQWQEARNCVKDIFEKSKKSNPVCNWYSVKTYWCVPCEITYQSSVMFARHLKSKKHIFCMRRKDNKNLQMLFDFCDACATLWYGYRRARFYHCNQSKHLWHVADGYYVAGELTDETKELLNSADNFANQQYVEIYQTQRDEVERTEILIRDLERAAKRKYQRAKAHLFGSRVTGVGKTTSDCDIFLDCGEFEGGIFFSGFEDAFCIGEGILPWAIFRFRIFSTTRRNLKK